MNFQTAKKMGKGFVAFSMMVSGCTTAPHNSSPGADRDPAAQQDPRGSVAEYDEGPPKDSKWPDIFAETPDYRAFGKAVYQSAATKAGLRDDGQEKFRWVVGPMWYRGRLKPNQVKVFVIGQEGAQDENTSNRTFTGSTGTKMQNFINYFGIDRSYLFMNTFIYTITGQYGEQPEPTDKPDVVKKKKTQSEALYWLAQDPNSAVVKHRHRMFDYMLEQNKDTLRLVIGVGSAGKDSLATWIKSHGGQCTSAQLSRSYCEATVLGQKVKAIGVKHPGAASARNGGSGAASALEVEFAQKAKMVSGWIQASNWMTPDEGQRPNFSKPYMYKDAPIPYRDFAFGSIWRLGMDGTASNRKGAEGIQVYSSNGCYNNAKRNVPGKNGTMRCASLNPKATTPEEKKQNRENTEPLNYDEPADIDPRPSMAQEDLPYESPKSKEGRRLYDMGPGDFAEVLMGQAGKPWPDFKALGVTSHPSFGFGQIYRGNLQNPEVLILADQESHDDMFSARALTGTGGQKLQTFLKAMGADDRYVIIRTLPVDTLDLSQDQVTQIALSSDVRATRDLILDKILSQGKTKLILTVGPAAAKVMDAYKSTGLHQLALDPASSSSHVQQWNQVLAQVQSLGMGFSTKNYSGQLTAIPRQDLPAHTRWWMGTSGSRASRAYLGSGSSKQWHPDYYKFDAPGWVNPKQYPADPKTLSGEALKSVQFFNSLKDLTDLQGGPASVDSENSAEAGGGAEAQ